MTKEVYFLGAEPINFDKIGTGNKLFDNYYFTTFDPNYSRISFGSGGESYYKKTLNSVKQFNSLDGFWIRFNMTFGSSDYDLTRESIVVKNNDLFCFRFKPDHINNTRKAMIYLYTNEDQDNPVISQPISSILPISNYGDIFVGSYLKLYDFHVYTKNNVTYIDFYENGKYNCTINKNGTNVGIKDLYLYPSGADANLPGWTNTFSGIIITNFDTRSYRLKTAPPSANGVYTEAIGSYTDIQGTDLDSNYVIFPQLDKKYSYKVNALTGKQAYMKIEAVSFSAAGMSDNINKLQMFVKSGNTETTPIDFATVSDMDTSENIILQTNPDTNQPWLNSEIPNIDFCIKSAS